MPVSPVRNIPSFEETRRRTPARDAPNQTRDTNGQGQEGLLIDFASSPQPAAGDSEDTSNPFDTFNATSAMMSDEVYQLGNRAEKCQVL